MSYNVHQLDRNRHSDFLAEQRQDPITKELLKDGDRIVVCGSCKGAFLEDSWRFQESRHCGQVATALEVQARQNTRRFSKPSSWRPTPRPATAPRINSTNQTRVPTPALTSTAVPQFVKVFGGIAGLLLLCMIASGIVTFFRNLGQGGTAANSTSNTARPGSSPISQPTTSYTADLPSTFNRKYEGKINGDNYFSLNLIKNGSKLEGKAETGTSWDTLSGTIDTDGSFEVEAFQRGNKQKHTGNYRGTIYDRSISGGTWSRPDGTGETSFNVSY